MYKLTVVAGPNRGTSYPIQEIGETTLGRQNDNAVVLPSARISKKHCSLEVQGNEIFLKDLGSSNGTFVNGVLAKTKTLKIGDRISVGEYVLEISSPKARLQKAPAVAGFGNSFERSPVPYASNVPNGVTGSSLGLSSPGASADLHAPGLSQVAPKDLRGKLAWFFENQFMPLIYGFNLKYQWRTVALIVFCIFVIGNVFISVYPLIESGRVTVVKEAGRRAKFMARQIADQNSQFFAMGAETKTEIGAAEQADGVSVALLMDLDSRVIAPSSRMNSYLTTGGEALLAVRARELFNNGRETGILSEIDGGTNIVSIEPVKIFNPKVGKNMIVAMALVSVDTSLANLDAGEIGVIYSKTLILSSIFGAIIIMILYRLTLKPYQVLSDDLDRGLKGELSQVTHEYKVEETNSLWEQVNSALQRIPKSGAADGGSPDSLLSVDVFSGPIRMMGEVAKFGLLLLDSERRIVYMNPVFEEVSGIRVDSAIGQTMVEVARDQGLAAFADDLISRVAAAGHEFLSEDFDFSGIAYKVHAGAFAMPGGQVKGVVICFVKAEG